MSNDLQYPSDRPDNWPQVYGLRIGARQFKMVPVLDEERYQVFEVSQDGDHRLIGIVAVQIGDELGLRRGTEELLRAERLQLHHSQQIDRKIDLAIQQADWNAWELETVTTVIPQLNQLFTEEA